MATISSPGIGSGIDVQSIVSQLVSLDKAALTPLKAQATAYQTKLSTYGTIKSQMSALGDAAAKLSTGAGWNGVTATSSNSAAVGVSVAAGAAATSLTLEVQQLAKAQSAASTAVASGANIGTGSLTIEIGAWSGSSFAAGAGTPVSISIGSGEDTLAQIAAKINDADAGVTATVLKDASGERLLMRSKLTGEENGFRITAADDDGNNTDTGGLSSLAFSVGNTVGTTQTQGAANAEATVNGLAIVSASNRLSDTLPGITLQLSQVTTAPVEIDVASDEDAVRSNVQAFIDAYNTVNTTLAAATNYDAGSKSAGSLQGDSTARGLQNALRGMMRSVTASSPFSRLVDVGIELQSSGKLQLNSEKFDAALSSDLDGLKDLFTASTGNSTTEGFGLKIKTFAAGLIDADGMLGSRTTALQKSLDRNSKDQERVNDRAARNELRYLAQYNAMDATVARLSSINSFITQQISLWNNA